MYCGSKCTMGPNRCTVCPDVQWVQIDVQWVQMYTRDKGPVGPDFRFILPVHLPPPDTECGAAVSSLSDPDHAVHAAANVGQL